MWLSHAGGWPAVDDRHVARSSKAALDRSVSENGLRATAVHDDAVQAPALMLKDVNYGLSGASLGIPGTHLQRTTFSMSFRAGQRAYCPRGQ